MCDGTRSVQSTFKIYTTSKYFKKNWSISITLTVDITYLAVDILKPFPVVVNNYEVLSSVLQPPDTVPEGGEGGCGWRIQQGGTMG